MNLEQMSSRPALLLTTAALFAAGVFVADLLSPLGATAWVLYLPVILAPVWLNNPRQVLIASAACSILVVVGFVLSHLHSMPWPALRNRAMGLLALWLTAFAGIIICRRSLQLADAMKKLQSEILQHQATEQALALSDQELHLREHEMLEIAAREQQRIGQELHDGVGQELTGLGLMANALSQRLADAGPERSIADRLASGLDGVHQQIRSLSRRLVPVQVEAKGLWAALDELVASASDQSGIPVTLSCNEWIEVGDHATATQLFRIAQEAVNNALRHGKPQHVNLSLTSGPEVLCLTIHDDGAGMPGILANGNGAAGRSGMGLRIMQYRAEQIGGALHVGPAAEGGTIVTCTLPLRDG